MAMRGQQLAKGEEGRYGPVDRISIPTTRPVCAGLLVGEAQIIASETPSQVVWVEDVSQR
jgi:hypothetical protein